MLAAKCFRSASVVRVNVRYTSSYRVRALNTVLPSPTTSLKIGNIPSTMTQELLEKGLSSVKIKKVILEPGCILHFYNKGEAEAFTSAATAVSPTIKPVVFSTALPALTLKSVQKSVTTRQILDDFSEVAPLPDCIVSSQDLLTIIRISSNVDESNLTSILEKFLGSKGGSFKIFKSPIPSIAIKKIAGKEEIVKNVLSKHGAMRQVLIRESKDRTYEKGFAYFRSEAEALRCYDEFKRMNFSVKVKELLQPAVRVSKIDENKFNQKIILEAFAHYENVTVELKASEAIVLMESSRLAKVACNDIITKNLLGKSVEIKEEQILDHGVELSLPTGYSLEELIADLQAVNITVESIKSNSNADVTNISIGFLKKVQAENAKSLFFKQNLHSKYCAADQISVTAEVSQVPTTSVYFEGVDVNTSVSEFVQSVGQPAKIFKNDRSAIVKLRRSREIVPLMKEIKQLDIDGYGTRLKVARYRRSASEGAQMANNPSYDQSEDVAEEFDQFALRKLLNDNLEEDPSTRYMLARNFFERQLADAQSLDSVDQFLQGSFTAKARGEVKSLLNKKELSEADKTRLFHLFLQREDMRSYAYDFEVLRTTFGSYGEDDDFSWSKFRLANDDDITRTDPSKASNLSADEFGKYDEDDKYEDHSKNKNNNDDADVEETMSLGSKDDDDSNSEISTDLYDDGTNPPAPKDAINWDLSDPIPENEKDMMFKRTKHKIRGDLDDTGVVKTKRKSGTHLNTVTLDNETEVSLENPDELVDREGRVWSGAILDTDTVQKVTPGNRVVSHRALVVVGNLKGSCGFGVGKGVDVGVATKAAFRDALRNLLHLDLYDNFGLAHDLHGKHNACHAYIVATPRDRIMIASPFATEILTRFGISTASCKIVGRRNPYSMVRAMFNALEKHRNIDETAKGRGLRYMTLRWAYRNKM